MKTNTTPQEFVTDVCQALTDDLKAVNVDLVLALEVEDYEAAAIIRDEIEHAINNTAELLEPFVDLPVTEIKERFYNINKVVYQTAIDLNNEQY